MAKLSRLKFQELGSLWVLPAPLITLAVLTGLTTITLFSCGPDLTQSKVESNVGGFVRPVSTTEEQLEFQLSRSPVPHRVIRHAVQGGRYTFDSALHQVTFDPMTVQEFEKLKVLYGGWSQAKSETTYGSHTVYTLADFVPPAMQAFLGFQFQQETTLLALPEGAPLQATTLANCWGTAYEILREARSPSPQISVFYAHDNLMKPLLHDSRYSIPLRSWSKDPIHYGSKSTSKQRNQSLKPGDLLIIGKEWLYHVAIFIDDDLFFEKSGTGDQTLFRFVTYDLLAKTWNPEIYGWSYRRFSGRPLPDAMSLFSIQQVFPNEKKFQGIPKEVAQNLSAVLNKRGNSEEYSLFLRKKYNLKVPLVP